MGAAPKVPRFDQNTLKKVPNVKANDTKPIMVDTIDRGENKVCEMVMPMMVDNVVASRFVRGDDWIVSLDAANNSGATRTSGLAVENAKASRAYCLTAHIVFLSSSSPVRCIATGLIARLGVPGQ